MRAQAVDLQKGFIKVKNLFDFKDLSHIGMHYQIVHDETVDASGYIEHLCARAGEETLVQVPTGLETQKPGADYYLNLSFVSKQATNYAPGEQRLVRNSFF